MNRSASGGTDWMCGRADGVLASLLTCAVITWAATAAAATATAGPAAAMADPAAATAATSPRRLSRLLEDPQACAGIADVLPEQPLGLDAVIARVVCHYPGVRRGDGLARQAQALLDRSKTSTQPALSAYAGADWQSGSGTGSSTGTEATLDLEWVLFDFGSRDAARREARLSLAATLDEQRYEVLNAVAEAAQLYGLALAAGGRVDAAARNQEMAQDSLRVAGARAGGGAGTLAEKLLAQTALAQSRLELTRANNQARDARGALAIAMGLPGGSAFALPPPLFEGNLLTRRVDLDALAAEARELHPSVVATRARLAQAQARVDSIGAERAGSVGLRAQTGRVRFSGDSSVRSTTSAVIGWTVPIFDRGSIDSRLREAQGLAQVREAGIDEARQRIELQVWQEGRALIGERDLLSESGSVQDSAEAALRVVSSRYAEGIGRFTDVLTAQSAVAAARFQMVEARANIRRAQLRLAAALGRLGPLIFD